MLNLYMRALYFSYIPTPMAPPDASYSWFIFPLASASAPPLITKGLETIQLWQMEAKEVMNIGKQSLTDITSFPRAGQRNEAVEEFIEGCVGLWERSGCNVVEGKEVVEVSVGCVSTSNNGIEVGADDTCMSIIDFMVGHDAHLPFSVSATKPNPFTTSYGIFL